MPLKLVSDIRQKINEGIITSWETDPDGDFTQKSEKWKYRAWFHPYIEEQRVVFAIWGRKQYDLTIEEYAAYHGKFVRMVLTHFDKQVDSMEITPLATNYDSIRAEKDQSNKTE